MTLGEIIILIVSFLALAISSVCLVMLFKTKKDKEASQDHSKDFFDYLDKMNQANSRSMADIRSELNAFKNETSKSISDSYSNLLGLVTNQLNAMNQKVDSNLKTGFETNEKNMKDVTFALGQIAEAQNNLTGLTKEVTTLNQVLTNSQQRGRFGEITLESLLENIYGETHGLYETQYVLDASSRPDAIVYLPEPDHLVCIDSKFSFVAYAKLFEAHDEKEEGDLRKDFKAALKSQVTKIGNDYIKPGKTAAYAIMFIPSDGIYAFLQSNQDFYDSIVTYARSKNVILTSPSTLQPILANIRMLQVNYEVSRNIKKIMTEIQKLRKENDKFLEDWTKFASTLDTLSKKKDDFDKRVLSINQKTDSLLNQADKDNLLEDDKSEISD